MGTSIRAKADKAGVSGWLAAPLQPVGLALIGAVENRRLFILLPFSLIAGLVLYAVLPEEPSSAVLLTGMALALALAGGAIWLQSLPVLRCGVQIAACWLGFCLLPLHGALYGTPMLAFPVFQIYEAQIDEIISEGGGERRVIVSALEPVDGRRAVPIRRARLLLDDSLDLQPGDRIRAALRLAPIPGPVLPGAHDGQFHSYFIGVGSYGSATGPVERIASGDESGFDRRVEALRRHIAARIDRVLSGDVAAIGKAMSMGDQSGMSDETRDVMAQSGLAHIYSISGLHLSIVAGGIFWLMRLALASIPPLVGWPVKKIAAVAGLTAAFLYLLLAGGLNNVPAFRSTLMLALIFGAVLADRRALTMRNAAIAAILIVLIDPASVFRPSFQLSFAAVVGLIGIYELPRPFPDGRSGTVERIGRMVAATAWTSLVAGVATLLFSAYHFQQTAPLGVLGNVLALPFVGLVIMPFGVLSVLAMPLGIDAPFIAIYGWGIERLVDIAALVAGWSEGLTGNPLLSTWTLIAALCALGWFAFIGNHWRLAGPGLLVPLVLALGFQPRPDVLISDTTQAVAIATDEGMALASGRAGSFAVNVWSRHYQTEIASSYPNARCDGSGCVVTMPQYSVAIVRNASAFAEDCGRHDLLITRIWPPSYCAGGGLIIGPGELSSGGVHWLRWNENAGRFDVRPAIVHLTRPWRVSPR